jgi:hypothetical protein
MPVQQPAMQRASALRGDNELVASLTQIIQQLEETAGGEQGQQPRTKFGK